MFFIARLLLFLPIPNGAIGVGLVVHRAALKTGVRGCSRVGKNVLLEPDMEDFGLGGLVNEQGLHNFVRLLGIECYYYTGSKVNKTILEIK